MLRTLDFVGRRRTWFTASLVVIALGLLLLAMPGRGLQWGIDFTGGVYVDLMFTDTAPTTGEVREALAAVGLERSVVQRSSDGRHVIIRTLPLSEDQRGGMLEALRERWAEFTVSQLEEVQPVIGQELTRRALLALALAAVGMIAYITVRFEFRFAIAAIVALLHDALVTIGVMSLVGMEVNSPFVAALLTIIGYSVNDTIVVFDRIRENVRERAREPLPLVVNDSIRQTLNRSINTSLTTLLAVGAILIFGGRTTRDFALALTVGVVAGTYSSIFIASPLWTAWKLREGRPRAAVAAPRPGRVAPAPVRRRPAGKKKKARPAQS
jgi:preprotein translocase subunit SecF